MTLQVCLWLWRDPSGRRAGLYSPDDVARMARSISRNVRIPHEIVCVTDHERHEFPSDIRVVPLWPDWRNMGGCYTRLKAFAPEMAEIIGPRFVWMDIDAVVTGDLTPLLQRKEDAVFWRSCTVASLPYNGSMVMMTAGARAQVWDEFQGPESAAITRGKQMIGTDQAWIAHVLGSGEAVWTAKDGVCAFRRDCRKWLPPQARLVFFPGARKPTDARLRLQYPWIEAHMDGQGQWPRKVMNDRAIRYQLRRSRRDILRARVKAAREATEEVTAA